MTRVTLAVLAGLLVWVSGCNIVAGIALLVAPEPTRDVPAKYPHLNGKTVCILVWAEYYTLIEYPQVQYEIAEYVRRQLDANINNVSVIPTREVIELQRRDPNWDRKHPTQIGDRFGAERVIEIQLTQYSTREPDSPHLYRGRISANVRVYRTDYPNSNPSFEEVVDVVYPENSVGQWGSGDKEIRMQTMQHFATEVAGLFYDRKVKVRK